MKTSSCYILLLVLIIVACQKKEKVESGYIQAGGIKVYYESRGEGPAVLLLHAGLQDCRMWDAQLPALTGNHRVITVDLPAHGKTTGMDTTLLMEDVLAAVLDSLHIVKTSVIGLSYGSASATDLVLAYPKKIDKVILVSPGLTGWQDVLKPDSISLYYFTALDSAFMKDDHTKTAALFTKAWCDGPFRTPEQVDSATRKYILTTTLQNLQQHTNDRWVSFAEETGADRAHTIENPVLIIYGDKDIPFIIEVSHFLNKSIAGSKEVMIPNVAHMLNMEAPETFNKTITDFLK
ncbi:MAG TPA: alpha/beta hydrolase [Ohtaekwangia sp.]|uniref:alpha/beta fold hydrolase n=1 Tax=Ohtaekwangia sp. TaxID=2066019 RepID=UPI002F936BE5